MRNAKDRTVKYPTLRDQALICPRRGLTDSYTGRGSIWRTGVDGIMERTKARHPGDDGESLPRNNRKILSSPILQHSNTPTNRVYLDDHRRSLRPFQREPAHLLRCVDDGQDNRPFALQTSEGMGDIPIKIQTVTRIEGDDLISPSELQLSLQHKQELLPAMIVEQQILLLPTARSRR